MNDDELLDALARSLHAPEAEPSPAELSAVHGALAGDGLSKVVPFPAHRRPHRPAFAAAAAAVILVAAGTTMALRHDGSNTPSVKVLATSEARLRNALATGDPAAIVSAADDLRSQLAQLNTSDREKVGDEPEELLSRASGIKPGSSPSGVAPAPPAAPVTTTVTSIDDHRDGHDGRAGTATTTPAAPSTTSATLDDHGGDDGSGHDGTGDSSGSGSGGPGPG